MKSHLAILLAAAITAGAVAAAEHNYTMVIETTEHSYLREAPSTSSEVASELAAGVRLGADPVTIATPDDPKCQDWFAAEYRLSGEITVHGFICSRIVRVV